MPIIDRDPAIAALNQHLAAIYEIIHGGLEDLQTLPLEIRRTFTPTTRAGMIHDFQIQRAAKYFSVFESVRIHELDKLILFDIEQKVALRFKKLDNSFRSRNQASGQVRNFRGQVQLAGVDAPSNLEAGYILNQLETEIVWAGIVCPNNGSTYWQVELKDATTVNTVTDLFDKSDTKEKGTTFKAKKQGIVIPINRDRHGIQ